LSHFIVTHCNTYCDTGLKLEIVAAFMTKRAADIYVENHATDFPIWENLEIYELPDGVENPVTIYNRKF
jgi:hypothetical protein